jgi:hypothetical protein
MDEGDVTVTAVKEPSLLPEMEMYAYLMVLMFLLDHKHYKEVSAAHVASRDLGICVSPWRSASLLHIMPHSAGTPCS